MKGKDQFTQKEIEDLKELINLRTKADPDEQKRIRGKMRKIGFYGGDDWGINDLQLSDLQDLIDSGIITITK